MATCSEVPKIRSTGLEVGPVKGLGDRRHEREGSSVGDGKALRRSASWGGSLGLAMGMDGTRGGAGSGGNTCTATTRLRKGGKWLGELDVRRQLMVDNPLLKRLRYRGDGALFNFVKIEEELRCGTAWYHRRSV